ncbi:hypothetical protein MOQ_007310, partial [Trypanosoma cruzi marinkellei]
VGCISVFSRCSRHILHWCMGRMLGRTTFTLLITFPFPSTLSTSLPPLPELSAAGSVFLQSFCKKEKCREMLCSMYRLSHNTVHLVYHHYCSKSTHHHRRHRTTARRGHTPAAHGQPSSSPSLLSLACSLQHKLTPVNAERKQKEGEVTQPRSVPSSNESHAPQQHLDGRGSKTIKTHTQKGALLARAPFLTLPQSLLQPFSLHSHYYSHSLSSGPLSTGSPSCAPAASATSLTIAGMHRPQGTHSATTSCRLFPPIMSATPIAYLHTCPMRCNHPRLRAGRHARHLVVIPVLGADPPIPSIHGLGAASGCQEAPRVWKTPTCVAGSAATHPQLLTHLPASTTRPHTRTVPWGI